MQQNTTGNELHHLAHLLVLCNSTDYYCMPQMVPASPGPAGYWSPMQPYPHAAVQYWDMPWHPPSMPSHAVCSLYPAKAEMGLPYFCTRYSHLRNMFTSRLCILTLQ